MYRQIERRNESSAKIKLSQRAGIQAIENFDGRLIPDSVCALRAFARAKISALRVPVPVSSCWLLQALSPERNELPVFLLWRGIAFNLEHSLPLFALPAS